MAIIKNIDNKSLAAMALQNEQIAAKMLALGIIDNDAYLDMKAIREANMDRAGIQRLEAAAAGAQRSAEIAALAGVNFSLATGAGQSNPLIDGQINERTAEAERTRAELAQAKATAQTVVDQTAARMRTAMGGAKGIGFAVSTDHANDIRSVRGGVIKAPAQIIDQIANELSEGEQPDANFMAAFLDQLESRAPIHNGRGADQHRFDMTPKFVEVTSSEPTFSSPETFSMDAQGRKLAPEKEDIAAEQVQEMLSTTSMAKLQKIRADHPDWTNEQQVRAAMPARFTTYLDGLEEMDNDQVSQMTTKGGDNAVGVRTNAVDRGLDPLLVEEPMGITKAEFQARFGIDLDDPQNAGILAYKADCDTQLDFIQNAVVAQTNLERITDRRGHYVAGVNSLGRLGVITGICARKAQLVELTNEPLIADATPEETRKYAQAQKELAAIAKSPDYDDEVLEAQRKQIFEDSLRLYCEQSLRLGIQEFAPTRTQTFTDEDVQSIRTDLAERAGELLFCAKNAEEARHARFVIETASKTRKQLIDEIRDQDRKHKVLEDAQTRLQGVRAGLEAKRDRVEAQLLSSQHRTARQQRKLEADYLKARTEIGKAKEAEQKLVREMHAIHAKEREALIEPGIRKAGVKFFKNIKEDYANDTNRFAAGRRAKKANPYGTIAALATNVRHDCKQSAHAGNNYGNHSVGLQMGRTVTI